MYIAISSWVLLEHDMSGPLLAFTIRGIFMAKHKCHSTVSQMLRNVNFAQSAPTCTIKPPVAAKQVHFLVNFLAQHAMLLIPELC